MWGAIDNLVSVQILANITIVKALIWRNKYGMISFNANLQTTFSNPFSGVGMVVFDFNDGTVNNET